MKYKIYIPTLGRYDNLLTAHLLNSQGIDFKLFVEDKEYKLYSDRFGKDKVIKLPGSNYGSVFFARNFIKEYSIANGETKHWQIDDDISRIYQHKDGKVLNDNVDFVLSNCENFVDRFKNIGIAGLSSNVFVKFQTNPFDINKLAYTCKLIDNNNKCKWEKDVIDDVDYNLQILEEGLCTIRFNAFTFQWSGVTTQKGGFTEIYLAPDRINTYKNIQKKWKLGKITSKVVNGSNVFVVDYNKKLRSYKQKPILL